MFIAYREKIYVKCHSPRYTIIKYFYILYSYTVFFMARTLLHPPLQDRLALEGSGTPVKRRGETPLNKPLKDDDGTLPIISR